MSPPSPHTAASLLFSVWGLHESGKRVLMLKQYKTSALIIRNFPRQKKKKKILAASTLPERGQLLPSLPSSSETEKCAFSKTLMGILFRHSRQFSSRTKVLISTVKSALR